MHKRVVVPAILLASAGFAVAVLVEMTPVRLVAIALATVALAVGLVAAYRTMGSRQEA